jgi:hypothetical protein
MIMTITYLNDDQLNNLYEGIIALVHNCDELIPVGIIPSTKCETESEKSPNARAKENGDESLQYEWSQDEEVHQVI